MLAAAHAAKGIPVLGINYMPASSVGFFCKTDMQNFEAVLKKILRGSNSPIKLPMLEVSINGKKLEISALNDVLFSSESPAEMTRYTIKIGDKSETQRSSGVWIAAGPGSTAAISSAGGKKMPLNSSELQFLVREPCPMPNQSYKIKKAVLRKGQPVVIYPEIPKSFVYIDGPDIKFEVKRGSKIEVRSKPNALKIFL